MDPDTVTSALLLAFENDAKVLFSVKATENRNSHLSASLISILNTINGYIEPFTNGMRSLDFSYFSPLVIFLVYKAALVITERLLMELDASNDLARLRTLRKFLKIIAQRWLSGRKLDTKYQKLSKLIELCQSGTSNFLTRTRLQG